MFHVTSSHSYQRMRTITLTKFVYLLFVLEFCFSAKSPPPSSTNCVKNYVDDGPDGSLKLLPREPAETIPAGFYLLTEQKSTMSTIDIIFLFYGEFHDLDIARRIGDELSQLFPNVRLLVVWLGRTYKEFIHSLQNQFDVHCLICIF